MISTEHLTAYINYENRLTTENKEASFIYIDKSSIPFFYFFQSFGTFVVPVKERSGCQDISTWLLLISSYVAFACPRAKLFNFLSSYPEARLHGLIEL